MKASLSMIAMLLVACVHAAPPAVSTVASPPSTKSAPATIADPCAELAAPIAALPGTSPPPHYPFALTPSADADAPARMLCSQTPHCSAVALGADGRIDRIDLFFEPERGRTREGAERAALDVVRTFSIELGLAGVPATWPSSAPGTLRLPVPAAEGIGAIDCYLETRPDWGPTWRATIARDAVTGFRFGDAKPLTRAVVQQRMTGRHYCVLEATGESEVVRLPEACDRVVGDPDSCRNAYFDLRRAKTKRVSRQLDAAHAMRAELELRSDSAHQTARLAWALSLPETATNMPPDVVVDAFTGETVPQLEVSTGVRIGRVSDAP